MKNLKFKAILLMTAWIIAPTIFAGVWTGGGGDNSFPDTGAAWFSVWGGQETIHTCIKDSSDFGFPSDQLSEIIESSFLQWDFYLRTKGFNSGLDGKSLRPVTSVEINTRCKGTEDLVFYFGVLSRDIEKDKASFDDPIAFSKRTEYDPKKTWGKGYVWIAKMGSVDPGHNFPNWHEKDQLKIAVLHEIGHILGNSHIEGTIMTSNLRRLMDLSYPMASRTSIDQSRELFTGSKALVNIGEFGRALNREAKISLYSRLTGKKPNHNFNDIKVRLTRKGDVRGWIKLKLDLIVDNSESESFEIRLNYPRRFVPLKEDIFVTAPGDGIRTDRYGYQDTASISYGYFRTRANQEVQISLEYNLVDQDNDAPMRIRLLSESYKYEELALFWFHDCAENSHYPHCTTFNN